jgi:hypothetical protein
LKISTHKGTIKSMVITASESSGVKCQVGDFSLLVDSPSGKKGNLVLKTKTEMPVDTFVSPEIIHGPGEYEVEGVRVRGVGVGDGAGKNMIRSVYIAELEGMRMAFVIGASAPLSENILDKFGEIDILFISAETGKLKSKEITSLIKQVDPSIVIPVTDKTAKLLSEEMGQKAKAQEKLVIKRKDLVKEDVANKLVWLKTK